MERIFSFSDFSALYEAEDPKIYEQNLKIVVSDLLALYYEMTEYGAYTDAEIDSDLQTIVAGSSLANKVEAFKSIISKVKQKALSTDKVEGAKELFEIIDSAYNKYLEALNYIVNKYKDSKEESDSMIAFVNKEIEAYKAFLDEETSESNSNFYGYSQIFEGKKSLLSDAENTVNSLRGKIDSYKMDADPRKKKFATDADLEIVKIANSIKGLKEKKNKDIEKSEIEKIFNDLATLGTNFDTGINKIIDENTTDAELEKLRNKARDVKDQISPLRNKYLKAKSTADTKGKNEKIKVSLDKDRIDYDPEETKNVNPEVKKFQELVTDAFKDVKSITDLSFYKKMGTDGKFGPNTRDMVKTLKGAFELSDKSGDITKELSDEIQIQKDTIKESISSRVYRFSSFVNVSEAAFNLSKGLEVAKSLKTYKSSGSSGGGSGITSAAKGEAGKMKKSASKEEIKAAEETQFSDKTPEEKWKWLTETYKAGYLAPGATKKVALAEAKGSGDTRTFDIYWEGSDPDRKTYLEKTVCFYPKSGEKLGEFKEYKYFSGLGSLSKENGNGYWGKKIDQTGSSGSGNFLYLYKLPEADKTKMEAQSKNVAWLNDNMGKYFKTIGTVKVYISKDNVPVLRLAVTKTMTFPGGGYQFGAGEVWQFHGNGYWYEWVKETDTSIYNNGIWKYNPSIKEAFAISWDNDKTPVEKGNVTFRGTDFPI